MARPLRIEFPGAFNLVTARALPRQRLFREDAELDDFLSRLPGLVETHGAVFHGFCVLPNHYHLLVETPGANLSRILHRLNAGYTASVNAGRKRRGPLFQSRYRSVLFDEEWLVRLSVYLHLNPIRKRLAEDPWAYRGSSARAFSPEGSEIEGLSTERVLRLAGGRGAYARALLEAVRDPPPAPWKEVWRQVVLGGEGLRARVLAALEGKDLREIPGFTDRPTGPALDDLVGLVAENTGLAPEQIVGGKFQRVLARKIALHLVRRYTECTLKEIGEVFGVDYTTVHMACRRLQEMRARDAGVDEFVCALEQQAQSLLGRGKARPEPAGRAPVSKEPKREKVRREKDEGQLKLF